MKSLDDIPFVSFETAKLLEEAGYGEESLMVYRYDTKTKDNAELICLGAPKKNIKLEKYSTVAALTLEEAVDFIQYRYRTFIFLEPVFSVESSVKVFDCWRVYYRTVYSKSPVHNYVITGKDKNETLEKGIRIFLTKEILDKAYTDKEIEQYQHLTSLFKEV